jgi:hypothetical protein
MSVESRRGRRALTFSRFCGARALQLFMINFHMKTIRAISLLFCYKLNIKKNRNIATPFFFTSHEDFVMT